MIKTVAVNKRWLNTSKALYIHGIIITVFTKKSNGVKRSHPTESQCEYKTFALQSAHICLPQCPQWHSTADVWEQNTIISLLKRKKKKNHSKINVVFTQLSFLLPFLSLNVGVHKLKTNIRKPGNLGGDLHTYHPKSSGLATKYEPQTQEKYNSVSTSREQDHTMQDLLPKKFVITRHFGEKMLPSCTAFKKEQGWQSSEKPPFPAAQPTG